MEYGSRLRFALIVIGGLLLLVLSIWGVTSLARRVIGNDSTPASTVKKSDLADYNKDSSYLRLTVQGPIEANEKYESYQIEVGQNYRDVKIFKGYDKKVIKEQRYANDSVAYEAFLKALKLGSYTSKNSDYSSDETGYCAEGKRYIYELIDKSESVQHTWNTSCGAGVGNFAGSGTRIRALFKKQIPDFSKLLEATKSKLN